MKIGRNEKCFCGSGKKYKKCHIAKEQPQNAKTQNNQPLLYRKHLTTKYSTLFALNRELRDVIDKMILKELPLKKSKSVLAAFFLGKSYKTHGVVVETCENGYGEDAAILVRSMFEVLITFKYIVGDETDGRLYRYLEHDWVLRKKTYDYARTKPELIKEMEKRALNPLPYDVSSDEIERRAKKAQEKYHYSGVSWSDKSIRDMSDDVGRLDAYLTVYRLQSQIAHTVTRVLNDYIKEGESGGFTIEIGPSENWISESLVSAFDFLYSTAGDYDKMHKLGFDKRLDVVAEKWVNQVDYINKREK